jgi:hypothetical protein
MEKRECGDLSGGANGVVFSLPGHGTTDKEVRGTEGPADMFRAGTQVHPSELLASGTGTI